MTKILVVEDEKILRDAFTIVLKAHGYTLDEAINGLEALELCKTNEYDLILLDLMMPVLDGVGFLKQTTVRHDSPQTKIIVLSNLSSGDLVSEALELGADRHAVKSDLSPKEIIKLVETVLSS